MTKVRIEIVANVPKITYLLKREYEFIVLKGKKVIILGKSVKIRISEKGCL